MMNDDSGDAEKPVTNGRRWVVATRLLGMGLLIALLHIPLGMIRDVLRERKALQHTVIQEIAGVWGSDQRITGPVLIIPYEYSRFVSRVREVNGSRVQVEELVRERAQAYFLPTDLVVSGDVSTQTRSRGIFDAIVFSGELNLTAHFRPSFAEAGIKTASVEWSGARIVVDISDMRGIHSVTGTAANDAVHTLGGFAVETAGGPFPLAAPVTGCGEGEPVAFDLNVVLRGSGSLNITPVGQSTRYELSSDWLHPSFLGSWLPVEWAYTDGGFNAMWETGHFSRPFPQFWSDRGTDSDAILGALKSTTLGVGFMQPVDGYRLVERACKYGVLFFVLVFTTFFLFEILGRIRIHPIQYGMVGAVLCLFFLLYLALSEVMNASAAYSLSAIISTAVISLYAWSVLKTGLRSFGMGGGLGVTYGYLYFVLQSQDYALLAGTFVLFAALALLMICTRRINWYTLE